MNSNKRIYGFWHIATIGQWQAIVENQFAKITGSGLYDASHAIFVNILGANSLSDVQLTLKGGKLAVSWDPDMAQFEYPTLQILQQRSRQEDFYCWYIHVKGATSSSGDRTLLSGAGESTWSTSCWRTGGPAWHAWQTMTRWASSGRPLLSHTTREISGGLTLRIFAGSRLSKI